MKSVKFTENTKLRAKGKIYNLSDNNADRHIKAGNAIEVDGEGNPVKVDKKASASGKGSTSGEA